MDMFTIAMFTIAIAVLVCIALMPIAITRLFRNYHNSVGWTIVIAINVALIVGISCYLKFASWKTDQSMHIRWNVQWFSDQYNRIDKLGNEDLLRDYVTNFCDNACALLNLDCKTEPSTSNLVERYYLDWEDRIDRAESAASASESSCQNGALQSSSSEAR